MSTDTTGELRRQVAAEKGIAPDLAPRLNGSTREELAADADDLLVALGSGGGLDGGARQSMPNPQSPAQAHGALVGRLLGGDPDPLED
ncbi:MAG: hypothetical protein JST53_00865 [Actinobacteria bacterium]|nr:hypothetical protein [Actinomycetota bacterium]